MKLSSRSLLILFFIFTVLAIILLAAATLDEPGSPETSQPDTLSQTSLVHNISPDQIATTPLETILQQPHQTTKFDDGRTEYDFDQPNSDFHTTVTAHEDQISKVVVRLPDPQTYGNLQQNLDKLGQPPLIMYNEWASSCYPSYVYPEEGLILLVDTENNLIYQLHKIPPTSSSQFVSNHQGEYFFDKEDALEAQEPHF